MLKNGHAVSLATIYNTLNAFTDCGLLGVVSVIPGRIHYDTNTEPHFHIFDEDAQSLQDIHRSTLQISGVEGLLDVSHIEQVDVIIRKRAPKE